MDLFFHRSSSLFPKNQNQNEYVDQIGWFRWDYRGARKSKAPQGLVAPLTMLMAAQEKTILGDGSKPQWTHGRTGLRAGRHCYPSSVSPHLSPPFLFGAQGLAADLRVKGCYHNAIIC
jgi:hypothetical protein